MIDFTTVRRLVETFLVDNFTTVPIQLENEHINVENITEFIALTDIGVDTEDMGSGTNVLRVDSNLVIQIYTELGEGVQRSRAIASELVTLLSTFSFDALTFTTPQFDTFGQVKDTDYYQQNLTFPYTYFFGDGETIC